jgi:Protein of unknown function (DUF3592)
MRHFDFWRLLPFLREIAMVLVGAATGTWAWFRTRQANSWPSAQGTIGGAEIRSSRDSYFRPWIAELVYTYTANGEYYSGRHRLRARSQRRAEARVEGWKGRMVIVRYSPDKHDLSVLLKSDQPGQQLGN